jgi:hypothetical protein
MCFSFTPVLPHNATTTHTGVQHTKYPNKFEAQAHQGSHDRAAFSRIASLPTTSSRMPIRSVLSRTLGFVTASGTAATALMMGFANTCDDDPSGTTTSSVDDSPDNKTRLCQVLQVPASSLDSSSTSAARGEDCRTFMLHSTDGVLGGEPAVVKVSGASSLAQECFARERSFLCRWQTALRSGNDFLPADSLLVIPRVLQTWDEEQVIAMEDLTKSGFQTLSTKSLLNAEDAEKVVNAVADFHSCLRKMYNTDELEVVGKSLKWSRTAPKFSSEAKEKIEKFYSTDFIAMLLSPFNITSADGLARAIAAGGEFSPLALIYRMDSIVDVLTNNQMVQDAGEGRSEEQRFTCPIHGDLWFENVLVTRSGVTSSVLHWSISNLWKSRPTLRLICKVRDVRTGDIMCARQLSD